jgi:hypothetical protein
VDHLKVIPKERDLHIPRALVKVDLKDLMVRVKALPALREEREKVAAITTMISHPLMLLLHQAPPLRI